MTKIHFFALLSPRSRFLTRFLAKNDILWKLVFFKTVPYREGEEKKVGETHLS